MRVRTIGLPQDRVYTDFVRVEIAHNLSVFREISEEFGVFSKEGFGFFASLIRVLTHTEALFWRDYTLIAYKAFFE